MTILVTYGSTRGGTEGLAEIIGDELRKCGYDVDVAPARGVGRLANYDAVIVGGALYAGHWHREARRFVKSHRLQLHQLPTYFFSSGPLGEEAQKKDIPPVRGVDHLMARVGARRHATFGGRLDEHAEGLIAASMTKRWSGDFRDETKVRAWAHDIAAELAASKAA
jgi:menaquinone-dependent protoporphyrinogen oxidase